MAVKHVVWDWNGTILNDVKLAWSIMVDMLNKRSMPTITLDEYFEKLSFPIIEYYKAVGFDMDNEDMEELSIEFVDGFNAGWRECGLQDGIIDLFEELQASGIEQSILSASRLPWLIEQVNYYNVDKYFTALSGRDDYHAAGKEYLVDVHLDKIDAGGEEIIYIGDTVHDYHVAQRMGAKCILCEYGHQLHDKLSTTGCRIIKDVVELNIVLKEYING